MLDVNTYRFHVFFVVVLSRFRYTRGIEGYKPGAKQMRATTRNASEFIAKQKEFKTAGSLSATFSEKGYYIVWSYNEPIACWVSGHGWFLTTTKFSQTTSRHTSQAELGIHYHGGSSKDVDSEELRRIVYTGV